MKFTKWNLSYKQALACLIIALGSLHTPVHASWGTHIAKKALFTLPSIAQKQIATALNGLPMLQTDTTEWRLKILVDDFMSLENQKPLSYYIDEFITIIDANPTYFKTLLFTHVLHADTPDRDGIMQTIRSGLEQTKHSKNVEFIKAMLYLPIRKWVRKDGKLPSDAIAEQALYYHASFNKG